MKKKTIFFLYPHLSFWNGGARYVFEVIKKLSIKYDLHLIVSKKNEEMMEEFKKQKIIIHRMGKKSTNDIIYWLLFPGFIFHEIIELKKLIKKHKPKVLVSTLFPTNFWAYLSKEKHLQICWEPFAFFYDKDLINNLPRWKSLVSKTLAVLYSWLDKLSLRSADKLLSLNKSTSKWVKKIYNRKTDGLTYMGVDFAHFKPIKNITIPERHLKRPLLFHSTDFTALKGTRELLEALKLIKKEVPKVLLLISSPHSDTKEKKDILLFIKKNNLEKSVKFLGTLPYKNLPQYYSLSDTVVFTGIGDSGAGAAASLSVLEALACGTPVVRSHYTKEEVKNGVTGFIVNPHKPQDISRACVKILKRSTLRKKMSDLSRESIRKKYSWKNTASIIENLLKELQST